MQQYRNNVQDQFGNKIASVTVTVNILPAGTPAAIFSDDGVTPKANPFTNDSDSEFNFYAANGRYDIELTGPLTESIPDIILFDEDALFTPIQIRTDILTATPPTTEAVTGNYDIVDLDGTDLLAQYGFTASNTLTLRNLMHGGNVSLLGEDAAGIQRSFLVGDPDALTTLSAVTNLVIQVNNGETAIVCIGNGNVELYEQNQKRWTTAPNGTVHLFSDTDTDVEGRGIVGRHASGQDRWSIGHFNADILRHVNQIHGANLTLEGEDAGGVNRVFFEGDPDALTTIRAVTNLELQVAISETALLAFANGETQLFFNNEKTFITSGVGIVGIVGDLNSDVDDRYMAFFQPGGTQRARIGHFTGSDFHFKNEIHGGITQIEGEDTGGVARVMLNADPDGLNQLIGVANVEVLVNLTEDAIICRANGAVELYFDGGQIQIATRVDGGTFITRGQVRHADGNMRDIGLATLVLAEIDVNTNLERQNSHKLIHKDAGVATSHTLLNDSNIPTGTTWMIANEDTEDITIDATTNSSLLHWFDGLGATPPTGDRTLAQAGVCTIVKGGVNEYYIWGTGLT